MKDFSYPRPATRRLRAYAFDPSLALQISLAEQNEVALEIPFEYTRPGPIGECVEVIDFDPASEVFYPAVDIQHPHLMVSDGMTPTEADPRFHQQMVYAVAMSTIDHFRRALGRRVRWRSRVLEDGGSVRTEFVQRLRLYPHALREANAYYDPGRVAVLFGYFPASTKSSESTVLPSGWVFTCLSYDVIAHEVTHALLDGMLPQLAVATNRDVRAFHEALADLVAIFQHFSHFEALRHTIAKSHGDLSRSELMADLAVQFGSATGLGGALRSAIRRQPDPSVYHESWDDYERASILVAAVFDAFLGVQQLRAERLLRSWTGTWTEMARVEMRVEIVDQLARDAAQTAEGFLELCIQALDYLPAFDVTFGDYLRALITVDLQQSGRRDRTRRAALTEAFRVRGIYPDQIRMLSEDALEWPAPELPQCVNKALREAPITIGAPDALDSERYAQHWMRAVHQRLAESFAVADLRDLAHAEEVFGLALAADRAPFASGTGGKQPSFEVRVRFARRVTTARAAVTDLILDLSQVHPHSRSPRFRGGCTLILDPFTFRLRHAIKKCIRSESRWRRYLEYLERGSAGRNTYHLAMFEETEEEGARW